MHSTPVWNATLTIKNVLCLLVQWTWLTSELVKRPFKLVCMKKWTVYSFSRLQDHRSLPTKTSILLLYRQVLASLDQWPRMAFKKPRYNVKSQIWFSSDLKQHSVSIPVNGSKQICWNHVFGEKSTGGCLSYDVTSSWPDLIRSDLFFH